MKCLPIEEFTLHLLQFLQLFADLTLADDLQVDEVVEIVHAAHRVVNPALVIFLKFARVRLVAYLRLIVVVKDSQLSIAVVLHFALSTLIGNRFSNLFKFLEKLHFLQLVFGVKVGVLEVLDDFGQFLIVLGWIGIVLLGQVE